MSPRTPCNSLSVVKTRYAKATFRKDRRLNIRLSSKDLEAIQKRALAEGLPYQTLIASLLHKSRPVASRRCSLRDAARRSRNIRRRRPRYQQFRNFLLSVPDGC